MYVYIFLFQGRLIRMDILLCNKMLDIEKKNDADGHVIRDLNLFNILGIYIYKLL